MSNSSAGPGFANDVAFSVAAFAILSTPYGPAAAMAACCLLGGLVEGSRDSKVIRNALVMATCLLAARLLSEMLLGEILGPVPAWPMANPLAWSLAANILSVAAFLAGLKLLALAMSLLPGSGHAGDRAP